MTAFSHSLSLTLSLSTIASLLLILELTSSKFGRSDIFIAINVLGMQLQMRLLRMNSLLVYLKGVRDRYL